MNPPKETTRFLLNGSNNNGNGGSDTSLQAALRGGGGAPAGDYDLAPDARLSFLQQRGGVATVAENNGAVVVDGYDRWDQINMNVSEMDNDEPTVTATVGAARYARGQAQLEDVRGYYGNNNNNHHQHHQGELLENGGDRERLNGVGTKQAGVGGGVDVVLLSRSTEELSPERRLLPPASQQVSLIATPIGYSQIGGRGIARMFDWLTGVTCQPKAADNGWLSAGAFRMLKP